MNTTGKTLVALGVAAAMLAVILSGCNVGDLVQVDVPPQVRQVVPSEPRVSFNQAVLTYEDWQASVMRTAERFQSEIDRKAEIVSLLQSLGNTAMMSGIPVIEQLPGGGLLATGLLGLGAWFLNPPGLARRIQKEKEASFNAGQKKAIEIAGLPATPAPSNEPSPRRASQANVEGA